VFTSLEYCVSCICFSQECHQQKQTISVLQREVDSIRGDNVKLYEKIKFLQSYPGTVSQVPAEFQDKAGFHRGRGRVSPLTGMGLTMAGGRVSPAQGFTMAGSHQGKVSPGQRAGAGSHQGRRRGCVGRVWEGQGHLKTKAAWL
jgi:hypothetical protein